MFMEKLFFTRVIPLFEYIRPAIWLSAISTVVIHPNLFVVKIAALTLVFEIYAHFKAEKRNLETKTKLYIVDCDLIYQYKERELIARQYKLLASLRPDK